MEKGGLGGGGSAKSPLFGKFCLTGQHNSLSKKLISLYSYYHLLFYVTM